MKRSVKFAVSLPADEFLEMEDYRKKENVSRSKMVLDALKFWKEARLKKNLIREYQEGYRRMPEKAARISGWEKAAAKNFSREDW